jgi:hypothetical protein
MSTQKPAADRTTLTSVTLAGLPYVTLLGCAGIVATVVVGFEEPHRGVLSVSALLLAAAPLGMALHLAFTDELSPQDRRAWVTGLISLKDPGLFGAYFTSTRRRQATERLRAKRQGVESDAPC